MSDRSNKSSTWSETSSDEEEDIPFYLSRKKLYEGDDRLAWTGFENTNRKLKLVSSKMPRCDDEDIREVLVSDSEAECVNSKDQLNEILDENKQTCNLETFQHDHILENCFSYHCNDNSNSTAILGQRENNQQDNIPQKAESSDSLIGEYKSFRDLSESTSHACLKEQDTSILKESPHDADATACSDEDRDAIESEQDDYNSSAHSSLLDLLNLDQSRLNPSLFTHNNNDEQSDDDINSSLLNIQNLNLSPLNLSSSTPKNSPEQNAITNSNAFNSKTKSKLIFDATESFMDEEDKNLDKTYTKNNDTNEYTSDNKNYLRETIKSYPSFHESSLFSINEHVNIEDNKKSKKIKDNILNNIKIEQSSAEESKAIYDGYNNDSLSSIITDIKNIKKMILQSVENKDTAIIINRLSAVVASLENVASQNLNQFKKIKSENEKITQNICSESDSINKPIGLSADICNELKWDDRLEWELSPSHVTAENCNNITSRTHLDSSHLESTGLVQKHQEADNSQSVSGGPPVEENDHSGVELVESPTPPANENDEHSFVLDKQNLQHQNIKNEEFLKIKDRNFFDTELGNQEDLKFTKLKTSEEKSGEFHPPTVPAMSHKKSESISRVNYEDEQVETSEETKEFGNLTVTLTNQTNISKITRKQNQNCEMKNTLTLHLKIRNGDKSELTTDTTNNDDETISTLQSKNINVQSLCSDNYSQKIESGTSRTKNIYDNSSDSFSKTYDWLASEDDKTVKRKIMTCAQSHKERRKLADKMEPDDKGQITTKHSSRHRQTTTSELYLRWFNHQSSSLSSEASSFAFPEKIKSHTTLSKENLASTSSNPEQKLNRLLWNVFKK